MYNLKQKKKIALGAFMLALTMTFGSMAANAVPISFDLTYTPLGFTNGNTTLNATIFLDDSDFSGVGTEQVTLTGLDAIINFSGSEGPKTVTKFFDNLSTNTITNAGVFNVTFVPYTAEFLNGNFTGLLRGVQPVKDGIFSMSFFFVAAGNTANFLFFGGTQTGRISGDTDTSLLASLSGPFDESLGTSVPEPTSLVLMSLGLIGLGFSRRKRSQ